MRNAAKTASILLLIRTAYSSLRRGVPFKKLHFHADS